MCDMCQHRQMCHWGLEHLVSAVLWAFDYLMTEGDLFSIQHRVGTRLQWQRVWGWEWGVTVPRALTGHMGTPCHRWWQPGLWPSTRATLAGWAWAACDYCGSQSALSCVRITEAATSPMYGLTLGLDSISWSNNKCSFNPLKLNHL